MGSPVSASEHGEQDGIIAAWLELTRRIPPVWDFIRTQLNALLKLDAAQVLARLQRGLSSAAHAAFVRRHR